VKSTDSPSLPRNEVAYEGRYGPEAQLQERDTSPNDAVFRQNVEGLPLSRVARKTSVRPIAMFEELREGEANAP
jgi:hypothetical protein